MFDISFVPALYVLIDWMSTFEAVIRRDKNVAPIFWLTRWYYTLINYSRCDSRQPYLPIMNHFPCQAAQKHFSRGFLYVYIYVIYVVAVAKPRGICTQNIRYPIIPINIYEFNSTVVLTNIIETFPLHLENKMFRRAHQYDKCLSAVYELHLLYRDKMGYN